LRDQHGEQASNSNGADRVIAALLNSGVDVMFANPGTTEVHLVSALDRFPAMRSVLCLFEGVASGAADGYARMTGRPAATLLHLGPGVGNAWANLHNARRGRSPVVNLVGDHPDSHLGLQSALESDIAGQAATVSGWVGRASSAESVGADVEAAVEATRALRDGRVLTGPRATSTTDSAVATLVIPADVSWTPVTSRPRLDPPREPAGVADTQHDVADPASAVIAALRSGRQTALLLGPGASSDADLRAADRIRQATGAVVYTDVFSTHRRRGRGLPQIEDLPFQSDRTRHLLKDVRHAVLLDAPEPVAPFAYPDRSGRLLPPEATVTRVWAARAPSLLAEVADAIAPGVVPRETAALVGQAPDGPLTSTSWGAVFAAALPEDAVISDESITSGMTGLGTAMDHAAPHDTLGQAGYAIGQGIPVAVGAAVACPDRPVYTLQADGSAMYTISGLWTQAREGLDITTVILDNGAYDIINGELDRIGGVSETIRDNLVSLGRPALDFVAIAHGMGVPGVRVDTGRALRSALQQARSTEGPFLIHARLTR
jgi:acetolactate synthase I/II/III large subunit